MCSRPPFIIAVLFGAGGTWDVRAVASGKRHLPSVNGFSLGPGINSFVTFTNGFAGIRHMGLDLEGLVVMSKLSFQSPNPTAL